jgi:hypothetical protein
VATNLYGKSCTPNTGGVLDFYTKSEINTLLASKAGTSTTYTQAHIDGQLSSLSDSISSLSALAIDQTDLNTALGDLQTEIEGDIAATYATLANTYTKTEVDGFINDLDLDPNTLLRKEPSTTDTNTIDPGSNNAIPLTLRGSSTNAIVQRWLDNSGDVIGYISNDGTATLEGPLTLGRLVSNGSAALSVSGKRITGVSNPSIGADAVSLSYLRQYTQYYYEQVISPSPEYEFQVTQIRTLVSVTDSGGDGSLSYDNTNGVFTYTGPSASEVRAHFSGGTGVTISNGVVGIGQPVGTTDSVNFDDLNLTGSLSIGDGTLTASSLTGPHTYSLPDVSGALVTTGDTGTITSVMISDGTIVDADVSDNAEIAVSKLADGAARQLLQTDAAGTGVEWTSNIDVPGTLDVTGVATFDNLISIGAAELTTSQQVGWNADKGTLDIGLLNGVLSPLGQDIITLCRNGTASPIPIGTAVMFTGETDGNSGRLYIAPMVADGTYPGYVFFGVAAQNIAAEADGYVKSFGEVKGVDTDIDEGGVNGQWSEGDILWCDPATPGGFTKFEPQAPSLKLPVAAVISVKSNGVVMVRWDTGRRLSDLHDVDSNGSTLNGELLVYNSTASRWEHSTSVPSLEVTESLIVNGTEIIDSVRSVRDVEESRLIRRNGTASIGIAGTVPFGVGPVIPPGMSLVGIGPDSYNVIDIYSGSVC